MIRTKKIYFFLIPLSFLLCDCSDDYGSVVPVTPPEREALDTVYIERAEETFEKIFQHYWNNREQTMYCNYPNSASEDYWEKYAAVWGYGAILSAYNAIYQRTPSSYTFKQIYESKVMDGLEMYWNDSKAPHAYGSYYNDWDDRYYDDNVWIGIDLIELYEKTKDVWYLDRAKLVWEFLMSGKDNVLGSGIYWKEGEKNSKNTCSNAPASVFGVKLYQSTKNAEYLDVAKELYQWVKKNLQDPSDYLYWDNMKTNGTIEKPKFSYNSGQMIQAGVLLYNVTGNESYLNDAKLVAESAYNYFFENYTLPTGETIKMLKQGSLWFHAIMLRGFAELYEVEKSDTYTYIYAFKQSLDYGWRNARSPQGLFDSDLSGRTTGEEKDILMQGAAAEMYARIAALQ